MHNITQGNEYPHPYANIENFKFISSQCNSIPQGSTRTLFPIVKGDYYDGNNDDPYLFRVVFVHNPSDSDSEGHPISYYCGTIYHSGSGNEFSGCDIQKS